MYILIEILNKNGDSSLYFVDDKIATLSDFIWTDINLMSEALAFNLI